MNRDALGVIALLGGLTLAACGAADEPAARSPVEAQAPAPGDETARALRLVGNAEAGARGYETCAVCHLPSGAGRADGTFPKLAGQHASVVVKQVLDIRRGRRRNPVMQPYAELGDLQDVADVAAYIATLPRAGAAGTGDGTGLAEGERLYARDCARCHGAHGEGHAADLIPRIAGQHYAYLLRQLRHIAGARRRDAHPEMGAGTATYTDAELQAVADFVARLEPGTPPPG